MMRMTVRKHALPGVEAQTPQVGVHAQDCVQSKPYVQEGLRLQREA